VISSSSVGNSILLRFNTAASVCPILADRKYNSLVFVLRSGMTRTVKKVQKNERKRYNQWECGRLKAAVEEYVSKAKEGKANLRIQGMEYP